MTIDIDELRMLAQDFKLAGQPMLLQTTQMIELLDRLEAAEKHTVKLLANLVQSEVSKREVSEAHKAVTRRLSVLADENTALHVKIAGFEQQKPVGEIQRANSTGNYICSEVWVPLPVGAKLYALPSAQTLGEEK